MAQPMRPEPKFFLGETQGSEQEYLETHYPHYNGEPVRCEKSTSYLELDHVPRNILRMYPDAKAIVLLRNPVERALSNYFYSLKNGFETRTLEEAFIDRVPIHKPALGVSVSPFHYLGRGLYAGHLGPWIRQLGWSNVKVMVSEALFDDPLHELTKLAHFMEIDPDAMPVSISQENGNEWIDEVPESVYKALREYYRQPNELLKQRNKVDISYWQS